MGVGPSSKTLPVMSCEDLASLAEDNNKTEVAKILREHEVDGSLAEQLDDDLLSEIAPGRMQQVRLKRALTRTFWYVPPSEEIAAMV